ncbi:MAG: hypothetical protein ACE5GM_08000 [bacterium]
MGVNSVIIQKYAFEARSNLIAEYKEKYTSKKGDRFNCNKITYEIANLFKSEDQSGFEFELSSKVPLEELSVDIQKYFRKVKSLLGSKMEGLSEITMEDTEKKIDNEETKLRDYIRVKFYYKPEQLYDADKINKAIKRLSADPEADIAVPDVPEVSSLPGKLVLNSVRNTFYRMAKENLDGLMAANDQALKEFSE